MTKQQLESIVSSVRMASQDKFSTLTFSMMSSSMYILGEELFGKVGNKCFWSFILDNETPFENIDELYNFLNDPKIQYINENPKSLGEMLRNNPGDKMLNDLAKVIYFETIITC